MRSLIDPRLREEARLFRFVFACPDCAYFDVERRVCSEGYPTAPHVRDDWERSEVVFCKLFEGA